jgi:hypothetical protein
LKDSAGFLRVRSSFLALLAAVGFSLIVFSSIGQSIEWIPPENQFGLLQIVPLTYWFGLSLIAFSILLGIRNNNEYLFLFQILLLFVSIWGAPSFYEPYPSIWDSYFHYQSVNSIVRPGISSMDNLSYAFNYPGFFVLNAQYALLGDPSVLSFLRFYPIFASVLTLLALYLFIRSYIPSLHYRFALCICVLADVWIQVHFSPQSLGFVAGLMVLVCLEKEGLEWLLAAIAVFGYVVISHPTTAVLLLGTIGLREILLRTLRLLKRKTPTKVEKSWPISIFLLIWISWIFTGALNYSGEISDMLFRRLEFLLGIPSAAVGQVVLRTSGNIFPIPPLIRIAVLGTLVVLTFASILIFVHWRRKFNLRLPANVLAIFTLPFIIIPLDITLLGGQFYDRGLIFIVLGSSIVLTIVMVGALKGRLRTLIAVGVMFLAGACMMTTFYQESLYVVSAESLSASDFLDDHIATDSFVFGGVYPDHIWGNSTSSNFNKFSFASFYPETYGNISRTSTTATAMVFDRTSELWHRQWGMTRIYEFYLRDAGAYNRVYDNGAYVIYSGGFVNR